MSDDAENVSEQTAEQVEDSPKRERLGCLATIIPVTTPGCSSLLAFVFLLTTVITVWTVFWLDANNVPWRHSFSLWRVLAIIALLFVLPWVVYKTVSLWLEDAPNAFPDLDYAWRAGMHALDSNQLSIGSVPVFLITGSSGEAQEKALMNASGMRFSVEGVPQGPAPIHWYANSEAICLFCSDASWTSALASLMQEISDEAAASGLSLESPSLFRSTAVDLPSFANPEVEPPRPSASTSVLNPGTYRGTIDIDALGRDPAPGTPAPRTPQSVAPPNPRTGQDSFRGTLVFGDNFATEAPATNAPPMLPPPSAQANEPVRRSYPNFIESAARQQKKPVLVSHQYSSSCLQELQHLGQLLRHARQPLCAINGIVAMIQFESIHSSPAELEELQKAIRADLETIQFAFHLRVPVSALIVGLEKERGFRELVLRVGKERAFSQRFGRRFDVQALPTRDELVALTTHVCGVFEDWAHSLFREDQALTRPGNTRLYELLAKVRCDWKIRLSEILAGGFGCEATRQGEESAVLFSGCYFAATGETPDRQAFVKGVFEKLGEEQELIEWTTEAIRANQRQNIAANLGMIVTVALLVSLLLMYLLLSF